MTLYLLCTLNNISQQIYNQNVYHYLCVDCNRNIFIFLYWAKLSNTIDFFFFLLINTIEIRRIININIFLWV